MIKILWKPLVGVKTDGSLYLDDLLTKYHGIRLLRDITNMRKGTPINLIDARRKQVEAELRGGINQDTPESVVKRACWVRLNLVGYMVELGYQIKLHGDEYSVLAEENSITASA